MKFLHRTERTERKQNISILLLYSKKKYYFMTRSLWKGPFSEISLSNFIENKNIKQKIWSRRSVILPQFIGKQFIIHNGKTFIPMKVTSDMVGHKMGEFATTRKKAIHKKKGKK